MTRKRTVQRIAEVEFLVLMAVLKLQGEAYAVPIRDVIAREGGVKLSRGTIYVTLDRLERKGLVESWFTDPEARPGGKARRVFSIRPAGLSALRGFRDAIERLSMGTVLEEGA